MLSGIEYCSHVERLMRLASQETEGIFNYVPFRWDKHDQFPFKEMSAMRYKFMLSSRVRREMKNNNFILLHNSMTKAEIIIIFKHTGDYLKSPSLLDISSRAGKLLLCSCSFLSSINKMD